MKAIVFHRHGANETLNLEEFPDPEAGPGECLPRSRRSR